jgi:hypothetical protein
VFQRPKIRKIKRLIVYDKRSRKIGKLSEYFANQKQKYNIIICPHCSFSVNNSFSAQNQDDLLKTPDLLTSRVYYNKESHELNVTLTCRAIPQINFDEDKFSTSFFPQEDIEYVNTLLNAPTHNSMHSIHTTVSFVPALNGFTIAGNKSAEIIS